MSPLLTPKPTVYGPGITHFTQERLVLVEGSDDQAVMAALVEHEGLDGGLAGATQQGDDGAHRVTEQTDPGALDPAAGEGDRGLELVDLLDPHRHPAAVAAGHPAVGVGDDVEALPPEPDADPEHGLPLALYGDRLNLLVRNDRHWSVEEQLTGAQFPTHVGRILQDLGVGYIAAHSPQAKGRIERLWGTLQDRLVSELRLAGARTPAEANAVLEAFVPTFNDRNDRVALNALAELMPNRHVVGIHAVDLVWGFGTLHCLTQQQPAPR